METLLERKFTEFLATGSTVKKAIFMVSILLDSSGRGICMARKKLNCK
jgi:hypothetical protein